MGMYTGFRFKGIVKKEYKNLIECLHNSALCCNEVWTEVYFCNTDIKIEKKILEWSRIGRSDFIPFGRHCYMPASWGEQYSNYDPITGTWKFSCSLKNYENEIETFMTDLLPYLIEDSSLCETLYEEDRNSKKYIFVPESKTFIEMTNKRDDYELIPTPFGCCPVDWSNKGE